jgi:hypothetical protein
MGLPRIRVVFLIFYFEAWDALASVYQQMLVSKDFDPIVVTIPRKLTGDADWHDEDKVSAFFDDEGIPHIRINNPDSYAGLEQLKELAPDYLFINYPWQRNYQPGYAVENLITFTKVCYVPYFSLPLVNEPGVDGVAPHQFTQAPHRLAHMVFLQDSNVKEAFDSTDRGAHAFFTGTPKIDALIAASKTETPLWPIESRSTPGSRAFRLIWAPHHSYAQRWLNFGVFTEMREEMLAFAAAHPEIDIVMRPHPFMFGTLTDRDLMTAGEVDDWRKRWNALPNTALDETSSFTSLMLACDALFTDGISFIAEFPFVTRRPAILWEKPDHWAFTPLGELAAATSIRVTNFAGFESALNKAIEWGLPNRSAEIDVLFAAASPFPGKAAEKIIEQIRLDAGVA